MKKTALLLIAAAVVTAGAVIYKKGLNATPVPSGEEVFIPGAKAAPSALPALPAGIADKESGVWVTAVTDAVLPPNANTAYASAFQIAWDTLIDKVIYKKPELLGKPPLADKLNEQRMGAGDIHPSAYFADAGYKKDGIEKRVIDGLKKKFNTEPINDISLSNASDVLAYAYMQKNLRFAQKFEIQEDFSFTSDSGKESKVGAFGIKNYSSANEQQREMAAAVTVNYYTPQSFVITLKGKDAEDEIILALIPKEKTLEAAVNKAVSLRTGGERLREQDRFLIPNLKFDVTQNFDELKKLLLNFDGYAISEALETIIFSLDAEGVELKAEAVIKMTRSAARPSSALPPKIMYFNKPFLVILKEKDGQNPYFALWVDNDKIMKK